MAIPPTASLILPRNLPAASAVTATDMLVGDNGAAVQRVTPTQIVNAATPLASQAEAEAGTNNNNRMTPLRVAQAISFQAVASATLAADTGATLVGATGGITVQAELDGLKQADIDLQDGVDSAQADANAAINTANAASSAVSSVSGIANAALSAASDALDGVDAITSPSGSTQVGWKSPLADSSTRTVNAKLREMAVTPQDFGAVGDGVADDTAAVQKAIDTSTYVFLIGKYKITSTIKTNIRTHLFGGGPAISSIVASGVSGPAILTYSGTGEGTTPYQSLRDFSVVGTATCAIAFAHCTLTNASNIHLRNDVSGFNGTDGFVFEYIWGCNFSNFSTAGSAISGTPFRVNRVVLATAFTSLYTSNATDYCIDIDNTVQQYSTGTASGTGRLAFYQFTAQGANKYAIRGRGYSAVGWYDLYTENNLGAVRLISGNDWAFYRCDFQGIRTGLATHDIWLGRVSPETGNLSGVAFNECNFAGAIPKVIGAVSSAISFSWCRLTGNAALLPLIRRTADTSSAMPLTILEQGTSHSHLIMKTNGFGWLLADMVVTSTAGVPSWSGTTIAPELTSITPY